jgi:hypothetical protein
MLVLLCSFSAGRHVLTWWPVMITVRYATDKFPTGCISEIGNKSWLCIMPLQASWRAQLQICS